MIQLILTRQCNFHCEHCMFSCTHEGAHMGNDVFRKALQYAELNGVNLLGGEPTLHPHFHAHIRRLAERSPLIRLVTNGSWVRDKQYLADAISDAAYTLKDGSFFVRITNDQWHRRFISESELKQAELLLQKYGVETSSDRMDDSVVFPLGRALSGKAAAVIKENSHYLAPAECIKTAYDPLRNLSIDIDGSVSACSHHQAICANIMHDTMPEVLRKVCRFIKAVSESNPLSSNCSECRNLAQESEVKIWNNLHFSEKH